MEKKTIEVEGKTIDEAIEKACNEFNLPRERLKIEILSEGSSGFLGLVGAKRAKIRAAILTFDLNVEEPKEEEPAKPREETPKAAAGRPAEQAAVPARLSEGIGADDPPFPEKEEKEDTISQHRGGRKRNPHRKGGQTLDALQYVVRQGVSQGRKGKEADRPGYGKDRNGGRVPHRAAESWGEGQRTNARPIIHERP
jgi:spoIIIJ-associated protein